VNLFAQLVRVDPGYRDAPQRLAYAESHARLVELYDAAQDALVGQRWLEAKDKLDEIGRADPAYRDTANLLSQAERALSEMRTSEDLAKLYEEGLAQYRRRQWHEASVSMQQVLAVDPGYQDASQLYSDARRHVRWSDSLLGRVSLKLSGWATGNRKAPVASGQHVESSDGAAAQKKEE
jgi:outer membrane protein assembly factor BamD (BamD/ComL family)